MLLVLAVVSVIGSWYVSRTRLGYALRVIGEDETVARHTGINTTMVKVLVFAIAAAMMALVGGVYALRYPSIDPTVGFGNAWSFQVLIAALLGGPGRPWGPAIGAVLLVFVSDFIVGNFSQYFTIALGICFVVIVYFIPGGVAPQLEQAYRWFGGARARARPPRTVTSPQPGPAPDATPASPTRTGRRRFRTWRDHRPPAFEASPLHAAHHHVGAAARRTRWRTPRRRGGAQRAFAPEERSAA